MPNEASVQENLNRQRASNSARLDELVQQQHNVEITRSLVLCFSAPDEDSAKALNKALFAKGTRILQQESEEKADARFHIRVGVKRSLRDAVREEFVRDLVQTAAEMNCSYDGWDLLTDEAAEDLQPHTVTPDAQTDSSSPPSA